MSWDGRADSVASRSRFKSPGASLPPSSRFSRATSSGAVPPASRYSRAPSISAAAKYDESYGQLYRKTSLEDNRINPSSYSYLSHRNRTPSLERPIASLLPASIPRQRSLSRPPQAHKHLHFPKTNLTSTKNLTLLIKSRKNAKHGDENLPVEVVAIGGKGGKSPVRDSWQLLSSYPRQTGPEYHSDRNYSQYFLRSNRRLGEMIRRVEMC